MQVGGTSSCVVTGAARGIGRGIAEQMVARGHAVVVTDVDGGAARRAAGEIGAVAGIAQDVRDAASHHEVAREAQRHGVLRAWFNNAGVGWDGDLADLDEEQARGLVDINLMGVVWGMRAAINAFGETGGDIVNTASLSGLGPVPGLSLYAATKAAVVSLTTSVHLETPARVRVHALCPDGVATDMVAAMDPQGMAKRLVSSGGRLLTVEEVATQAVALVGSRRVVRTVPGWRGAVMRGTALVPSVAGRGGLARGGPGGARAASLTPLLGCSNKCSSGPCAHSNRCSTLEHMLDRTSGRKRLRIGPHQNCRWSRLDISRAPLHFPRRTR